jgi:hypothetical protein
MYAAFPKMSCLVVANKNPDGSTGLLIQQAVFSGGEQTWLYQQRHSNNVELLVTRAGIGLELEYSSI